jgi:fructokinase
MIRLGVDLGGTKIEAIVLNSAGETLFRERVPTPKDSYEGTLQAMVALIYRAALEVSRDYGMAVNVSDPKSLGIGLATPGALSLRTGLIKNANSMALNGQSLDKDLGRLLGREVKLANDANCLVVSEAHDGAAAGANVVFGVILGTGVGGGLVVHGKLILGANAIAGEWGHNPLPQFPKNQPLKDENPSPCYCGHTGCIETWLSGTGFAKVADLGISSHEIIERMRSGDIASMNAFAQYTDRLARALASVINVVDPDVIVLGGGMSLVDELYTEVPKRWLNYVFSDEIRTRLLKSKFGDSSGVRGAAWL